MAIDYGPRLRAFDDELARMFVRGQWTADPARRESTAEPRGHGVRNEPRPAGIPYLWKWTDLEPQFRAACEALPESFTARRALAFRNPELPRCTAQTISMTIQVIRPREIAWTHRHTIAALRFVVDGDPGLRTVVDGIPYAMEDNDLVLTPSWTWHDHRNDSGRMVCWVDVLDVPFVGGLSMGFYEELGETTQPLVAEPPPDGGQRYPWIEAAARLRATATVDAHDGVVSVYPGRATGGAALPTLQPSLQRLPPGFSGRRHRHTSSTVYHVVSGEGTTEAGDTTLHWSARDCFVVPNWTWHSHRNRSASQDAVLFAVSDEPGLRALGYFREEA